VALSADGLASARDLARFYQALLRGGELGGVRVLELAGHEGARHQGEVSDAVIAAKM
jgi:CubicO group peptidase (beta-lactamase class C family)